MPSTTSRVVSSPLASSTVITPSFPTFSIASAMICPMVVSPLAEMVPTWAISFLSLVGLDCFFRPSTIFSTAFSMPRLISIGLWPAATSLEPSRKMAWASTVAVVVPSPATSEVLEATSLTIWAPMFSNLFSSSISLATVTPSLVMVGEPNDFSSTTLRPLGPRVTFTASARVLTPRRMASRARTSKTISFAAMIRSLSCGVATGAELTPGQWVRGLLLDHSEHVLLAEDQVVLALDLHFGARVLAEQDPIAGPDVERPHLAVLEDFPVPHRDHLALERLLLGRIGDDDPALGLVLLGDALDDEPILKGTNLHLPFSCSWAARKRMADGVCKCDNF